LDVALPLLPEDFLLTYADAVPGLRRFDVHGTFSSSVVRCISTLAAPVLAPAASLGLRGLRFAVPLPLHRQLTTFEYPW
jgi:acyl dehydratase